MVDDKKHKAQITNLSLFFSELDKGRWIGINENEKYVPASLMKVVVMMVYLKKAENNKGILGQNIFYSRSIDDNRKEIIFDGPSNLKIGGSYSVDELISRMIIDSDNGALALLLSKIDTNLLNSIYESLTVQYPVDGKYLISPRDYSLFFRVLYSATYLNEEMSEKALSLLSKSKFTEGLAGGLPEDIAVAHKFGEHVVSASNGQIKSIELHDCGIINHKLSPYFLCVMTSGSDINGLKKTIQDISSLVYKEVSRGL